MITKALLESSIAFLMNEQDSCLFCKCAVDDNGTDWGIAIGWSGGFDEDEQGFGSGEWRICAKFCYANGYMRTDYEIDFDMPDVDGCVIDTDHCLSSDLEAEAKYLNELITDLVQNVVFQDKGVIDE
jgi:hypothetical protein